jgi:hypothetical protein
LNLIASRVAAFFLEIVAAVTRHWITGLKVAYGDSQQLTRNTGDVGSVNIVAR